MSRESASSQGRDARQKRLALVKARLGAGAGAEREPIARAEDRAAFPLSTAQQRLWLLEQASPGSLAYQVPAVVHTHGPVDEAALERSAQALVDRHEILRARFKLAATGEPISEILPALVFRVDRFRVDIADADPWQSALAAVNDYVRTPFDLEQAPLFRVMVVEFGRDECLIAFVFHHIVCEAWSLAILFEELERLYAREVGDEAADLPPVSVQFGDFARWERARIESEAVKRDLEYWAERLRAVPALELPSDRPRPPVQTLKGAVAGVSLSESLARSVEEVARGRNTTPFVVTLSALYVLLHRYTALPTLTVGTPVSNRDRDELQRAVGFYVDTLVFRADLAPDDTFGTLVEQVRETVLEGFSRQQAPFERIVDELKVERDSSRNPLFQVMFAFQNSPMPALELRHVRSARMLGLDEVHSATSRVDLSMVIEPRPSGAWHLWAEYSTDLFDRERMERLLAHYETVLEALVGAPSARIAGAPLMPAAERQRVIEAGIGPRVEIPEASVVDMIRRHAARDAGKAALRDAAGALTYGQLEQRSDALARMLLERGVGAGSVVAVFLPRSIELVIAELAVLKAGAAYAPIDPAYPPDRVAFMLSDAACAITLTSSALRDACAFGEVICLDEDGAGEGTALARAAPPASANDLAYVIYTSGSTGRPKGVEVEHGGLKNLIAWHHRTYGITPRDVATLVASPGFDASVWEIWPYLTGGATIAIPDEDVRMSPELLIRWLLDNEVTITFLPTPLAEAVLSHAWPDDAALRAVLTGGDALHPVRRTDLPFRLYNHYGPTEGTVVSTFGEVRLGDAAMPSIGRPIDNTEAYVLDQNMQPVPIGVPGELYVAGAGLARGYRNEPELTRERFVDNPLSDSAWRRAYKTGDTCRYREDGSLQFEGRRDTQVKIRGFRVELGEIESILVQEPGVRECAVALRTNPGSRQAMLVAYIVASTRDAAPSTRHLRKALSSRLPQYMIPQAFLPLEALPKSSSGKVDRNALPEVETDFGSGNASREPGTPAERIVAEAWKEVLGVSSVGADDNFFDLGGNSLLAVQVVRKIQQSSGRALSPLVLISGTLAQAAESLEEAGDRPARRSGSGLRRWVSALARNFGRPTQ